MAETIEHTPSTDVHICAVAVCGGTKDGLTAADNDVWYVRPVLTWREHMRAMIVRSRLGDESDRKALRDRKGDE